ncbi:MAG: 3-phosphoglycerate dehydrogenase, partial [Oscillospiraceae bacterium]|nr:3-phosphoglycerate dehydrogenase [Oscillospiraceae bacterium]
VMATEELNDYLENGNLKNSVNLPNVSLARAGVCRLCVIHRNVPKMLNRFLDLIAAQNINVEHMINKSRGNVAYTIIDAGAPLGSDITDTIAAMEEVLRVRVLS